MLNRSSPLALIVLIASLGCGESDTGDTGGTTAPDATPTDATSTDAPDSTPAATSDAGPPVADAGAADPSDAATPEDAAPAGDAAPPPDGAPPDLGPVTFSPLRVEELAATRAVIRFETNQPTSCEVEYGATPDPLDQHATDPNMVEDQLSADHEVPLEDLQPDTEYRARAKATDAAGEVFYSGAVIFRTPAAPPAPADLVDVATLEAGALITGVSSNWGGGANDSNFGAEHAVDGQMGTEWATAGDGDGAWLEIDLGAVRTIHAVGYRSRSMADGTSVVTRCRFLLPNGTVLGPYDTPDPSEVYTFPLAPPVEVDHLRWEALTSTGGNTGARQVVALAPLD